MIQELHAPPPGIVIKDDPYGHALIDFYKPWLLANRLHCGILQDKNGSYIVEKDFETLNCLPWTVLKTNEFLTHLFIQDTELPIAVPPIGTVFKNRSELNNQYPEFAWLLFEEAEYLSRLIEIAEYDGPTSSSYYEYLQGETKVIAHPPHSVVVPFVKPVEAKTETPQPKESEEPKEEEFATKSDVQYLYEKIEKLRLDFNVLTLKIPNS